MYYKLSRKKIKKEKKKKKRIEKAGLNQKTETEPGWSVQFQSRRWLANHLESEILGWIVIVLYLSKWDKSCVETETSENQSWRLMPELSETCRKFQRYFLFIINKHNNFFHLIFWKIRLVYIFRKTFIKSNNFFRKFWFKIFGFKQIRFNFHERKIGFAIWIAQWNIHHHVKGRQNESRKNLQQINLNFHLSGLSISFCIHIETKRSAM